MEYRLPKTANQPEAAELVAIAAGRPVLLSAELDDLIARFAERAVTLREVMAVMQGRGFTLLLVVLALPFCTPIPMMGLSAPFGLVIALIGLRMSLGQKPWLPARLLDTTLPPRFFATLLEAGRRVIRILEWGLRPRHMYLVDHRVLHHFYGVLIFLAGFLLLLPVPVPFANFFPAVVVVLTASALMQRDGYAALAAMALFAVTLGFFGVLAWGGAEGVNLVWDWLGQWLSDDLGQNGPPAAPAVVVP